MRGWLRTGTPILSTWSALLCLLSLAWDQPFWLSGGALLIALFTTSYAILAASVLFTHTPIEQPEEPTQPPSEPPSTD